MGGTSKIGSLHAQIAAGDHGAVADVQDARRSAATARGFSTFTMIAARSPTSAARLLHVLRALHKAEAPASPRRGRT